MPELNLQLGHLLSQVKQAKEKLDQKKAKRELGQLMTLHANIRVSSAQEQWEYHFKQKTELAQQFDQAATLPEYTAIFQKLGFIEATSPTAEQKEILQALEQAHIDEASPADRITIDKLEKLTTDTAKQAQQTIQALAKNYFHSLVSASIPWQERPEIDEAIQFLKEAEYQKVLLLTGDAGIGKSAIVAKIAQKLSDQAWLVLPFRLDILSPTYSAHQLGEQLGLPDSPVHALAEAALDQPCLLVIDQLDAVSMASGRHPQFFSVVRELIDEANLKPNIRVLLACRAFDLNNDDRFQQLIEANNPIAKQIHINELSEEQVKTTLKQKGFFLYKLKDKQICLLRNPLYITLFLVSKPNETEAFEFQSLTDLYDLFWKQKQRILTFNLAEALAPLAEEMSNAMGLSLPDTVLDHIPQQAEILLSEGILRQEGHKIAFFHESFFDYVYARRFLAGNQDLLSFLLIDEQHLFRRAQVRQVLTMLRQKNQKRYLKAVDDLLHSPDIRFHLKELVMSLLSSWPDPFDDEWEILEKYLFTPDLDFILFYELFSSSPEWVRYLFLNGKLKNYFESQETQYYLFSQQALHTLSDNDPDLFVKFATPYLEITNICQKLSETISSGYRLNNRSYFNLIKEFYKLGSIENNRFWQFLKNLYSTQPDWAAQGAAQYLQTLSHPTEVCERDWYANKLFEQCAREYPQSFIKYILPEIFKLTQISLDAISNNPFHTDNLWSIGKSSRSSDIILKHTVQAIENLTPEQFSEYQPKLKENKLELAQYLLIKGYTAHAATFADQAIETLYQLPARLHIYEQDSDHPSCAELLRAITPHASPSSLEKLESLLLQDKSKQKFSDWMKYCLLTAIVPNQRSLAIQKQINDLAYQFPKLDPHAFERRYWAGEIDFPLSIEDPQQMTDLQWVTVMEAYNSDYRKQRHQDGSITGGTSKIAGILHQQALKEPKRFINLFLHLPDSIIHNYFKGIVFNFTFISIDPQSIAHLFQKNRDFSSQISGFSFLRFFSKQPKANWPIEALQIIADYALNHPNPSPDDWRNNIRDNDGSTSIRGFAARVIGHLLEARPEHFLFFRPIIEKMIYDPVIAVRVEIAYPVTVALKYDTKLALQWFVQLADTHDDFLKSFEAQKFMRQTYAQHFITIRPIIERMLQSNDATIAKEGAMLACLVAFTHPEAEDLAQQARTGSASLRLGAAEVYSTNLNQSFAKEKCIQFLPLFFDDSDTNVRQQAGKFIFRFESEDFSKYQELLEAFTNSQAFSITPFFLLMKREKSITSIQWPEAFFDSAEAYLSTGGYQHIQGLEELLFPLYTQQLNHPKPNLSTLKRCLNLFDQMTYQRAHEFRKGMKDLDRA